MPLKTQLPWYSHPLWLPFALLCGVPFSWLVEKKKNQTIIRDNVFVGSNTSIVAPVTIGNNSTIGAGSVITKNIPSNSLSIERNQQINYKKKLKK